MQAELERLIRLQDLDTAASSAKRQIAEAPARKAALEARLADHRERVAEATAGLEQNSTARAEAERDLAAVQTRLSKYKNQLMEVKTNKEYQAMQHEIAAAEAEIRSFEDVILERMLQADELTSGLRAAEAELTSAQAEIAAEQAAIEQEQRGLELALERSAAEREALAEEIDDDALALFATLAGGRGGIALSEARNGLCSACHVRLRPQVYNEVQKNDAIRQCENCQRILYYVPAGAPNSAASTPSSAPPSASSPSA